MTVYIYGSCEALRLGVIVYCHCLPATGVAGSGLAVSLGRRAPSPLPSPRRGEEEDAVFCWGLAFHHCSILPPHHAPQIRLPPPLVRPLHPLAQGAFLAGAGGDGACADGGGGGGGFARVHLSAEAGGGGVRGADGRRGAEGERRLGAQEGTAPVAVRDHCSHGAGAGDPAGEEADGFGWWRRGRIGGRSGTMSSSRASAGDRERRGFGPGGGVHVQHGVEAAQAAARLRPGDGGGSGGCRPGARVSARGEGGGRAGGRLSAADRRVDRRAGDADPHLPGEPASGLHSPRRAKPPTIEAVTARVVKIARAVERKRIESEGSEGQALAFAAVPSRGGTGGSEGWRRRDRLGQWSASTA